jgi:hypothetical protein
MSITSNPRPSAHLNASAARSVLATKAKAGALIGVSLGALLVGACLPGPWSYYPSHDPVFRGISVSGYAVADRPVEHFCFEKVLTLEEAASDAFPFYDSAAVGITGTFSNGGQTLVLTPDINTPNCFKGSAAARFVRSESYALNARFVWDSAGVPTVTVLTATAQIPTNFQIADTAYAPGLTSTGVAMDNITDPDVFNNLPPDARAFFVERYGDTLTALDGDSAGLAAWKAANEVAMKQNLTLFLLSNDRTYRRGDSVYYLNATNNFSNLSHFFKARRDNLVKGILISHRYDTTASRPESSFDSLFGISPDSAAFYTPGDHRRLIFYGDYRNPDGRHVFDSMGVVNVWYWSGINRLYFYGTEKIYSDFQVALAEQSGNSKIGLPTNITGGRGFFAGMIVDSFDLHLKLDSETQSFPYALTRAAACRDKGWHKTRDCIGYYPQYCQLNNWEPDDCMLDAIYRGMDPVDSLTLTPTQRTQARAWAGFDPALKREAERRYCTDKNYPTDVPACAAVKAECENSQSGNGCQILLWTRCQLAYWRLPACTEGKESYCRARSDVALVMCRE